MSTKVFFTATTPEAGRELWVTDGTAAGTRQVIDINPGSASALRNVPGAMAHLGDGRVVFTANDGTHGRELWVSDGTEAGTQLVRDIRPGGSSNPYNLVPVGGGRVVLVADDGVHGRELWVTDGTAAGTRLLKDINPGAADAFYRWTAVNYREAQALGDGRAVFIAEDGTHGRELWVTDGTAAGTRMVADIRPGPEGSVRDFGAEFHDDWDSVQTYDFFFDIAPGRAVFFADDGSRGRDIWVTDGTAAGTVMLVDHDSVLPASWPEADWSVDYIRGVVSLGEPRTLPDGRLFYNAVYVRDEATSRSTDIGTDGTASGTVRFGQTPHAPQPAPDPVMFRLEADEGVYPAAYGGHRAQLGDGRLVYSARADYRVTEPLGAGGTQVVTYSLGLEPWITDGTPDGTQMLRDLHPGPEGARPTGFTPLPDGRVVFSASDAEHPDNLFVTDGSDVVKLAAELAAGFGAPFPDGSLLGSAWDGGLWFTDGTPEGTVAVPDADVRFARFDQFLPLGPRQWLFDAIREPTGDRELWVTDGTPQGTSFVSDAFGLSLLDRPSFTPLGDGLALLTLRDDDHGSEPWVFDAATGRLELLADLLPGTGSSVPARWLVAHVSQPDADLFPEWVTMPGEETAFVLDDYFRDQVGDGLSYSVAGLPAGVAFDPATGRVAGTVTASPDIHEVQVIAADAAGQSVTASFDWVVPDTGLLRVAAEGGWHRPEPDGAIQSRAGDVLIGHRDGDGPLLRIEGGGVSLDSGRLAAEGWVWPGQTEIAAPLMRGSFAFDVQTLAQVGFTDTGDTDSLALAGGLVSMGFDRIGLKPDQVAFGTDLAFDGMFAAFDTEGAPLSLIVDATGLSFGPSLVGTGRWFADGVEVSLPGASSMTLGFENIGLFYDMVGDSLYLNGKATLSWGGDASRQFSFIAPGPRHQLILDLAGDTPGDISWALGDKYLRLGFAGDSWDWDVVGTLTYAGSAGPILPGWPELKRLSVDLNTPDSHVGGGFVAKLPLYFLGVEIEAHLGAFWDPFQIDSFTFGLDDLNKPLGLTGLFVQGGTLSAEGLAGRDPDEGPSYGAQLNVTVGPAGILPTPLRGSIAGTLETDSVEVGVALASVVGDLVPSVIERFTGPLLRWFDIKDAEVLAFEIGRLAGTVAMDVARPALSGEVQVSLLNATVSGLGRHDLFKAPSGHLTHVVTQSAEIAFPDPLPVLGGHSLAGSAVWRTVADDRLATDHVSIWATIDLPLPVWGGTVGMGLRAWKDGRIDLMGLNTIEEVGSWQLGPEQELVILSARWDVPADAVTLELVTPGGVLSAADIAARDDIALVDTLGGPTARHVAIHRPESGLWDLRVSDPAGLGALRTEASEVLPTPVTRIDAVTLDPETLRAEIALAASPLAAAAVTLFAADAAGAPGGRSLVELGPLDPGEATSVSAALAGLAPGSWWLHARTEAEGHAPGLNVFDTPVVLAGAADMGLGVREGMDRDSGARTLTVEVANRGDRPSGDTVLHVEVPETMLGDSGPAGYLPFAAPQTSIALASIAPGAAETLRFALPAGLEVPAAALTLRVEAEAWDATPADNLLTHFLSFGIGEVGGRLLARDGTPVTDMALTLRLPDGSEHAARSDENGRFRFDLDDPADGLITGPPWTAATGPTITTGSALETLRMAVGLQPSWGPAAPEDFIAADVNADGRVTTADALEILRVAVGLPSDHAPRWIFFDTGRDFGEVSAAAVPTDLAPDLADLTDTAGLALTALLTGHVHAWT